MAPSRRVALTFDNGPDPGVTGEVLDTLAARALRATFFVIGQKLASPAGRALALRAKAEGHRLGNHTFTHTLPLGLAPPEAVEAEIAATQRALGALAPEKLFRPYGSGGRIGPHLLSVAARDMLASGGYTCVLWNALPRDWEDPDGWMDRALAQCLATEFAVLVLHDLPTGAMRHLPVFLDRLADSGVSVADGFPLDCLPIQAGAVQPGCAAIVTPPR